MPARRAFGRLCLSPAQMSVLLTIDRFHRRLAGRPYRPTLVEISLETNITPAGIQAHLQGLFQKGYVESTGASRYRNNQLTMAGRRWCKAKRRRLARRNAKETR